MKISGYAYAVYNTQLQNIDNKHSLPYVPIQQKRIALSAVTLVSRLIKVQASPPKKKRMTPLFEHVNRFSLYSNYCVCNTDL